MQVGEDLPTIVALNNLGILSGDIEKANLSVSCREKVWLKAGPGFGHLQGRVIVVKNALYGLKSSGASFCAYLAEILDNMGFKNSLTDPDVWMRPVVKLSS